MILGAFTIWTEYYFRWFFLDKCNCTFLPVRKRNRLNRIIWSEISDASWPGSGYISCQQDTWRLNFLSCETFYQTTWKTLFFWRRRRQFLLLAAAASTFRQGNQQSTSTLLFSLDVARIRRKHAGSPNHASKSKTQVPTTRLVSFSPAGLAVVF